MPSLLTRPLRHRLRLLALLVTLVSPAARAQAPQDAVAWPTPGLDTRPWARWWWMGSAVTRRQISAELRQLANAGFGGVEVTAIYGVRGAESASVPYLSPRWVELLAHTASTARGLGMGVDLPQGSGWRMGGPFVPATDANASLSLTRDSARAGAYTLAIRPSGDRVKRPAPGGEGAAIDVFSRAATDRYLIAFADRLAPLPRGTVRSFFHDSFEYTGDGSTELAAAFARRRGYDLTTELTALAGAGEPDHVARVKSDYRQTLDEMLLENFVQQLTTWSHARGSLMREQAHGSPGNLLDLYAAADIPETESFGPLGGADADPLVFRFASSAAHVAGRRLASAEAFTWLGEHFSTSLDEMKRAADQLFLAGINHLVYHGTAYSPADAPWPGWEFYASSEFNSRNAWWRDLPVLNAYVTRVQSVLQ
ncbi:MAG: glycoside hydrolase, partial [Gemmatimonadota bacterium]|nr:glycoside hydrolase [Gemmatimonadota bacterium]